MRHLLGTTVHLEARDSKEFEKLREPYMQSSTQMRNSSLSATPALWPLVSCFKVYCNAAALSTGAVLVDLPGTNDSNAARSAVADGYMKIANCVWILAIAERAISEKSTGGESPRSVYRCL